MNKEILPKAIGLSFLTGLLGAATGIFYGSIISGIGAYFNAWDFFPVFIGIIIVSGIIGLIGGIIYFIIMDSYINNFEEKFDNFFDE